jgi:hypothetical protein
MTSPNPIIQITITKMPVSKFPEGHLKASLTLYHIKSNVVTVQLEFTSPDLSILTVRRTSTQLESWNGWPEQFSYWLRQLPHPEFLLLEGLKVGPSELAFHTGAVDKPVWFVLRGKDSSYGAVFMNDGTVLHGLTRIFPRPNEHLGTHLISVT